MHASPESPSAPPRSAARGRWRALAARLAALDLEVILWRLLCALAIVIPVSIAATGAIFVTALVVGAEVWRRRGFPPPRTALDLPILAFVATAILAALLGLDPAQSLWGLRGYVQVTIVYLVAALVRSDERMRTLLACFLGSIAFTSAYAVLAVVFPWPLPEPFPKQMTQSGQLLFAISLATALVVGGTWRPRAAGAALALYVLAVVANRKRGVWLGVTAAIATMGVRMSRRLLFAGALAILVLAAVPQVRDRVQNTSRDLLLPGGRRDIWMASVDVVRRFPMGVGRKNGSILRDYPNIPQRHKHAHNNLLTVALENGILGAAAFLWWMLAFGRLAWRISRRPFAGDRFRGALAVAVFSSFVGFHVAGLVEYNFGDSEVLDVLFLVMGIGLALDRDSRTPARI